MVDALTTQLWDKQEIISQKLENEGNFCVNSTHNALISSEDMDLQIRLEWKNTG